MLVYETNGRRDDPAPIPQRVRTARGARAVLRARLSRAGTQSRRSTAQGEYEMRVTNGGRNAIYIVQNHPFDVIGWDGYCYPYAFNLDEFAPITGKLHQPPPAHATFEAPGAAFCAFVPRLFDYHPLAIPVPYNHSSVDCDEVLYYVSGNFMSRRGVEEGSITLARRRRSARSATRRRRAEPREDVDRRNRGDDRHVQAAAARARRALSAKIRSTSAPGSRQPASDSLNGSRFDAAARRAESDAARAGLLAPAAQRNLVAVLEERAFLAVGELDRTFAVPRQLDETSLRSRRRAADRARRKEIARTRRSRR